jgi:predicted Zn-dependent protease with MMP-like domain
VLLRRLVASPGARSGRHVAAWRRLVAYRAGVDPMPVRRFEQLVADALDAIPPAIGALIDNVVVQVEDRADGEPDLLGIYEGVPHTERADYGIGFVMPDRIVIYRLPICAMCETEDEVVDEVAVTVIHELAHHFGIDDDELDRLGWA